MVLVSTLILGVLALEGALRVRQYVRYGTPANSVFHWRIDPATSLRLPQPNQRSERLNTNSLGFRGDEVQSPKPKGVVRIAFVGASTTLCAEVSPDGAIWPALVAAGLAERFPGVQFDFVNAGVPGFTVEQSQRLFEHTIAGLEPDVVVVLHATNDLTIDTRRLAREAGFREVAGEEESFLARNWLSYRLIQKNLRARRNAAQARTGADRLQFDPDGLADAFRARLEALLDTVRATAPLVAVATFAHRIRPEQNTDDRLAAAATNLLYMPYLSLDGLLAGYGAYNRAIVAAAASRGVLLIGGHEGIPATPEYFEDSVHFTAAGCRWMADRVLGALERDPRMLALVAGD